MPARAALLHQLARIEAEKDALLAELDHCSPTRSETVPYTGGWTVAQVITHLAVIEEGAVAYLNKKLEFKKHRPLPDHHSTALRRPASGDPTTGEVQGARRGRGYSRHQLCGCTRAVVRGT